MARRIAVRTTLFLLVVELVGSGLLEFFGISLPVVQVAGGLVLASMGWSLLNQQETESNPKQAEVERAGFGPVEDKVFYPLTFPLTVGPGCIVVMLTLSAHASAVRGVLEDVMAHVGISLAVVFLSLIVLSELPLCPEDHGTNLSANGARRLADCCLRAALHRSADHVERCGALLKTVMKG